MLTEKQTEYTNLLNNLRKQIELLDSHITVLRKDRLITDKQYQASLARIVEQIEKLEEELEYEEEDTSVNATLDKIIEILMDVRSSLEKMSFMYATTEELFDDEVHKAIEEIENESKENN